jgi:hypothetical protein
MPAMVKRHSFSWLEPVPAKSVLLYLKFFPFNQFQLIEQHERVPVSTNSGYEYSSGLA